MGESLSLQTSTEVGVASCQVSDSLVSAGEALRARQKVSCCCSRCVTDSLSVSGGRLGRYTWQSWRDNCSRSPSY